MSETGKLILLGAGGHARVVAELARATGWDVTGFLAPAEPLGKGNLSAPVLGTGLDLEEDPSWLADHDVFPAIGHGEIRWREFVRLAALGARIPSLVHPAAVVSPSTQIEGGAVIMAGVVVQARAVIGAAAVVNTGALIDHDCRIGQGAMIAPGAVLCGDVHVGEHSFIAAGAVVIPGIRIGKGVFVGAGTVVTNNLPDGSQLKATRRVSFPSQSETG